jgi:NTP pyrophosphatase (non-canonical NTP hydrolase)
MMNQTNESTELSLSGAQRLVDEWIREVGVRYFNELTNMAMLTEEVGEVARIIARRYGEQSEKPSDAEKVLADELADVLFVVICLANQTGVDLELALKQNLAKKTNRDATRHKQNPKITD